MSDLHIRPMKANEISIAIDWAAAEGWNPGLQDAICFATVDPEGFLIGEIDGAPVATAATTCPGAVAGTFARADIDYLDADGTVIAQLQDYECVIDPALNQSFRRNQLGGGLVRN